MEEKLYFKQVDSKKVPPSAVIRNFRVKVKNMIQNDSFGVVLVYPDAVDVSKQKN